MTSLENNVRAAMGAVEAARRTMKAHIKSELMETDLSETKHTPLIGTVLDKEVDDALDLPVQFEHQHKEKEEEEQTDSALSERETRSRRVTRKPRYTQRVWRLDIIGDAFDRWRRIGEHHGLTSDTEIAVFLMQHYENALAGLPTGATCVGCHMALTLTCAVCGIASQHVDLSKAKNTNTRALEKSNKSEVKNNSVNQHHIQLASSLVINKDSPQDAKENVGTMDRIRVIRRGRPPGSGCKPGKGKKGKLRKYKCQWDGCDAAFAKSSRLKAHNRIHTGEKPYVCKDCGKAFTQNSGLKVHMQKHTGLRPFTCEECGASFPSTSTLKQHMRRHTGEKPFKCKECDKTFRWSGHLTQHMRMHTGIKPFLCPDCGKAFAASSDLVKHRVTHTKSRPFACSECGKAYSFLHRLTAHMRSHTGDRPFLCSECGAAFARAHNLTVHMRTHTGVKPYRCEDCGAMFSDSGNFSKHKKTKHGDTTKTGTFCAKNLDSKDFILGGNVEPNLDTIPHHPSPQHCTSPTAMPVDHQMTSHLPSHHRLSSSSPTSGPQIQRMSPSGPNGVHCMSPMPAHAHQVTDYRNLQMEGTHFSSFYNYQYYYQQ